MCLGPGPDFRIHREPLVSPNDGPYVQGSPDVHVICQLRRVVEPSVTYLCRGMHLVGLPGEPGPRYVQFQAVIALDAGETHGSLGPLVAIAKPAADPVPSQSRNHLNEARIGLRVEELEGRVEVVALFIKPANPGIARRRP